jgi:5-methylcytosine-specific restriction endonuclease McrA
LKYKAQCIRSSFRQRTKDKSIEIEPSKYYENWLRSFQGIYICYYTGEVLTEKTFTVDHKQSLEKGGSNDISNLCLCSKSANDAKGSLNEKEFFQLLELLNTWDISSKKNVLTRLKQAANIFRPSSK